MPVLPEHQRQEHGRQESHKERHLRQGQKRQSEPQNDAIDHGQIALCRNHRQNRQQKPDRPAPAVVVHRDRSDLTGSAIDKRRRQDQHTGTERRRQPARQPRMPGPPDRRQDQRRKQHMPRQDRLAGTDAKRQKPRDRRKCQNTQRRMEILVRQLSESHPHQDIEHMQGIALVLVEVKPALAQQQCSLHDQHENQKSQI